MKTTLAALCVALACTWSGAAEPLDPDRLAEARALLRSMQVDRQLDAMAGAMGNAMARQLAQMPGGGNQRVAQISIAEAMAMTKEEAMRPGGMIDIVTDSYAARFSVDELRQIRAFYESPVGRRLLQTTPEVMEQVMQASMASARDMLPRVCARVKARLAAENLPEAKTMRCPASP